MYKKARTLCGDAELDYKPFAILKQIRDTGEEVTPDINTSAMFRFLNDDKILVLDLREREL